MPIIEYKYKIVSVDPEHKTMSVEYTSPIYGTTVVCTHFPYSNESLESLIAYYNPVIEWVNRNRPFLDVPIGTSGTMSQKVDYV
jgi:hypothetical protein|tara:strand:- start:4464 stop:4715 length:252 start_codon:yes stop_codon:yes gene_type:complete